MSHRERERNREKELNKNQLFKFFICVSFRFLIFEPKLDKRYKSSNKKQQEEAKINKIMIVVERERERES